MDSLEHHQQAGRTRLSDQVWMAVRTPLLVLLLADQMYLPMLLVVQKDLIWLPGPTVDQILLRRAVQRQASDQGLRESRMLPQAALSSLVVQTDLVFDRG